MARTIENKRCSRLLELEICFTIICSFNFLAFHLPRSIVNDTSRLPSCHLEVKLIPFKLSKSCLRPPDGFSRKKKKILWRKLCKLPLTKMATCPLRIQEHCGRNRRCGGGNRYWQGWVREMLFRFILIQNCGFEEYRKNTKGRTII